MQTQNVTHDDQQRQHITNHVNWSRELKEINDLYPDLKVTFSGSSLVEILNADADLSRRALSFREFLSMKKGIQLQSYTLDEILCSADEICTEINETCHPQQYFDEVNIAKLPYNNKK